MSSFILGILYLLPLGVLLPGVSDTPSLLAQLFIYLPAYYGLLVMISAWTTHSVQPGSKHAFEKGKNAESILAFCQVYTIGYGICMFLFSVTFNRSLIGGSESIPSDKIWMRIVTCAVLFAAVKLLWNLSKEKGGVTTQISN